MANLGFEKVMMVLVVALVFLGPERLPEAARTLGRAYAKFASFTDMAQAEVRSVVNEVMESTDALGVQVEAPPRSETGPLTGSPDGAHCPLPRDVSLN